MQSLPDIPPAGRKAAIEHYLKNAAADFAPAEQAEMARHVLTILNDLIFADLFAPGSRAEVPIVGRLVREGAPALSVAGQVDRLAVTRDSVLIADYKTDRAPPSGLAEVPDRYTGQLALYRAVLGRVYPGKTIRAALIFTEGPTVDRASAGNPGRFAGGGAGALIHLRNPVVAGSQPGEAPLTLKESILTFRGPARFPPETARFFPWSTKQPMQRSIRTC